MCETAEMEEEISLVDIVRVFIRHKALIVGGTLLITVIALVIGLSRPDTYKVSFVMELGSTGSDLVESPGNLTSKVKMGYSFAAMRALKVPEEKFPEIMVINPEKTKHIEVALETSKPSSGIDILSYIESMLLKDHEKVFDRIRMEIEGKIKKVALEVKAIDNKDKVIDKKLTLIQRDKDVVKKQMLKIEARINELLQEKLNILNKTESDKSFSMLEVSNQIFQNRKYYNDLQEKLSVTLTQNEIDLREEALNNEIERQSLELEKLNLESKRDNLQKTRIIKEPSYINVPVGKKNILLVVSAFFVGLIGFSLLALLTEFAKNLSPQTGNCNY